VFQLLLFVVFFSPPWLLRLLVALPPPFALCASLFEALALAPLFAAWERELVLVLPLEGLELRDAIDISLDWMKVRGARSCAFAAFTLGAAPACAVVGVCRSL
jgi:hypothetical protein